MPATRRLYHVRERVPGPTAEAPSIIRHHIVRAASQAAAIKFIAAPRFDAGIPTPDDLVALVTNGVAVVDCGDYE